jgi:hypothetical protein
MTGEAMPRGILAARGATGPPPPQPVLAELYMAAPPTGYFAEITALRSRFTAADGTTVSGRGRPFVGALPSSPLDRPHSRFDRIDDDGAIVEIVELDRSPGWCRCSYGRLRCHRSCGQRSRPVTRSR